METVFDLASVTKPFVAVLAVQARQLGAVDLRAPLARWIPEIQDTPAGQRSLEDVLSHRAGLQAHLELFAPLRRGEPFQRSAALRQAAEALRPELRRDRQQVGPSPWRAPPPLYSDLGYLLAGEALARAFAEPLDRAVRRFVTEPIGVRVLSARQWQEVDPVAFSKVAPTETVAYRGGEIVGRVHDDNAWAWEGLGLCGHAGLFATAEAVARFGTSVLDALAGRNAGWLSPESAAWLTRPRPGGSLRAGFDGKSLSGSSAGRRFGRRSFGHLGFTGTSLWCDPDADIVAVLLSNRVNPTRNNPAIRGIRPRVHSALHCLASRSKKRRNDTGRG